MHLAERLKKVAQEIAEIADQTNNDIYEEAPLVVYQVFCNELVAISKKNEGAKLEEVSDFADLMTAIDMLEKLFPNLKNKQ